LSRVLRPRSRTLRRLDQHQAYKELEPGSERDMGSLKSEILRFRGEERLRRTERPQRWL